MPRSLFGKSSLTVAGALLLLGTTAYGQDPFATPGAPVDPFADAAPTDPFASAAPADPFASAAPADPFASSAAPADPFASEAPADPFADAAPADPFASAAPADPFASGAPADPFAGTAPADPFGDPAAPADPFGDPTTTADPFGGGGDAAPADPFGGTGGASSTPFDGGDPFASTSTGGGAETINPDGIEQLYDFRYERKLTWDGREIVVRRRLLRDEARDYDEARRAEIIDEANNGELANYVPGSDLQSWSKWVVFAEQLQLYSEYLDQTVLGGNNTGESLYAGVKWPGAPETPDEAGQAGTTTTAGFSDGKGGVDSPNMINDAESRSLDSQANDFNPFAGLGAGGTGGASAFSPKTIMDQIVPLYQAKLDQLRTMEKEQEDFMKEFEGRLLSRQTRRLAYVDWLQDRKQLVEEFVEDWNRRYNGDVAVIGGVRYELYRPGNVPRNVHKDATVIVTDYRLTPYDILNPEDGTLKQATRN
ncbi:MAG: hypothetical protein PWP23_603 [Candidatus Sumerlaeota bacterium]|nr:hypothetical protein [Candidatus Sumerlaeota bacterium]